MSSIRQYKGKIKQWGLDTKYTKTEEYMEIVKTKQKLKDGGSSSSSSQQQAKFTVRGKPVSDSSISRFERRAKKRGILPAEGGEGSGSGGNDQTQAGDGAGGGVEYADEYQDADYDAEYQAHDYQEYQTGGYEGMPSLNLWCMTLLLVFTV